MMKASRSASIEHHKQLKKRYKNIKTGHWQIFLAVSKINDTKVRNKNKMVKKLTREVCSWPVTF